MPTYHALYATSSLSSTCSTSATTKISKVAVRWAKTSGHDSGKRRQFAEEVLAPLNKVGDEEGCHFDNGKVTVPRGW